MTANKAENKAGFFVGKWASQVVCSVIATLLIANCSFASTLVGTVVTSSVESIPEMDALITAYNLDLGASLPAVGSQVDKLEDDQTNGGANFIGGNLLLGDFDFGQQTGGVELNVFDASLGFSPVTFGVGESFSEVDNPVFGFEQVSGVPFTYYVSKDGNLGWSLWLAMDGINPVYTDSMVGGFTRGEISDNSLSYDPVGNGVSHISFYSAIPEPSSLLLAFAGGLSLTLTARRRR